MKVTLGINRSERIYSLLAVLVLVGSVIAASHFFSEKPREQPPAQWSPYSMSSTPVAVSEGEENAAINSVKSSATVKHMTVQSVHPQKIPGLNYPQLQSMIDAVSFTDSGDVALSENTRAQLEQAVVAFGLDRTADELNALHLAIAEYLPQDKARSLSNFFSDYYAYKQAERDYMQAQDPDTLSESLTHYEMIKTLRTNYLGKERAEQLFQAEDEFMRAAGRAMNETHADN